MGAIYSKWARNSRCVRQKEPIRQGWRCLGRIPGPCLQSLGIVTKAAEVPSVDCRRPLPAYSGRSDGIWL